MQFQEYPKALYRQGQIKTVHDERDEHAARADGFDDWAADNDACLVAAAEAATPAPTEEELRRGADRLREWDAELLAKQHDLAEREEHIAAAEQDLAAREAAFAERLAAVEKPIDPPTRDELKAQAAALGIEHAPNISTEKLAALVAEHQKGN